MVEPSPAEPDDLEPVIAPLDRGVNRRPRHTSIVYFHGMGTPRRYEELSRVLDGLDRYANAQNDPRSIGQLRDQLVRLEPSRVGADDPVAFIRFFRLLRLNTGAHRRVASFRLYESYWSPATAGGISAVHVLMWVLARALNPFVVLFRPWRAHQRLKLTYLFRLAYDERRTPAEIYRRLQRRYREFEGMDARREHRLGRFHQFLSYLREKDPEHAPALERTAHRWRRALAISQLHVLLVGALALASLAGLLTLALGGAIRLLMILGAPLGAIEPLTRRAETLPAWMMLVLVIGLPVVVWFGRAFFQNFLADVVFWTTTFEKDTRHQKRKDILKACEATLRHVLSDPACERVVIIGHSLGTAIAYETLLNLGRRFRSESGGVAEGTSIEPLLDKLSHFITFGSPIDRIAYFFSLHYSRYHRFNRVLDDLAGKTSDPPFRMAKRRNLQWINVRDACDPVASRLFAPRSAFPNRDEIVEVEVASGHMPDPVGAHGGYFESRLGAKIIFDACILDRPQVQAQVEERRSSRVFRRASRGLAVSLAMASVVCLAGGAFAFWTLDPALAVFWQNVFLGTLGALGFLAACGRWLDHRQPLTLPA